MKRFHTILCPTDFSHGSEAAFQYALDLARDYNARLVVLHSQEPAVAMIPEAGLIPIELPDNETAARKLLDDVRAVGPAITLEKIFAEGQAADCIISTAESVKADLIVMGTHGRTGIGRLLLGSVAEQTLRKAPCPVLTVRVDKTKTQS